MTIPTQNLRTALARPHSRVLPRVHWGWYAAALIGVLTAARNHPAITACAVISILATVAIARIRPRRLTRLFRRVDQIATRIPARSPIPRNATAARLQTMHWSRFEQAGIAAAQKTPGVIEAVPTGKSGDRGCDGQVRLVNGQSWLLQFKRYNAKNNVDGETVRATVGAARLAGCHGAAIVTSSGYTREALAQAAQLGVVLFDGNDTAAWFNGGRAPWQTY